MVLTGAYLILHDKILAGSILSGVTSLGIIGLFASGNNSDSNKKDK